MDETKLINQINGSKVIVLTPTIKSDLANLNKIRSKNNSLIIINNFDTWLKDSFIVNYPKYKSTANFENLTEFKEFCSKNHIMLDDLDLSGVWVFFEWKNELVHLLPESLHHQVITARNKNLISHQDQEKFYKTNIAVAGLSVGQSAALTISTTGGAKKMTLADFDRLDPTNLNRIKGTVSEVGDFKCDIAARQIYSVNPFAKLNLFYNGINDSNIEEFLNDIDLIVDEIDNFHIKALLRNKAREKKLPLVSAFDTADGVVLDVERYDTDPKQQPFFGNISNQEFEALVIESPSPREIPKLVTKTMGENTIPDLFKSSIIRVGSELAGVPQLGSTAFFAGATVAFATKMIISGHKLKGRYYLDLRKLTGLSYDLKLKKSEKDLFQHLVS